MDKDNAMNDPFVDGVMKEAGSYVPQLEAYVRGQCATPGCAVLALLLTAAWVFANQHKITPMRGDLDEHVDNLANLFATAAKISP